VKKDTQEYKDIQAKFLVGGCKFYKIASIKRIQNPFLWSLAYCKEQEINYKHFNDTSRFDKGGW
jgi:hypothetical protein